MTNKPDPMLDPAVLQAALLEIGQEIKRHVADCVDARRENAGAFHELTACVVALEARLSERVVALQTGMLVSGLAVMTTVAGAAVTRALGWW